MSTPRHPASRRKLYCFIVAGIVISGLAALPFLLRSKNPVKYATEKVKKGELTRTIKAIGTVQPDEVIDVGAQAAGQILSLGKDALGAQIDFGSPVEKDAILANIDETLSRADLTTAETSLRQSESSLNSAKAMLIQSKSRLRTATREWERAKVTLPAGVISQSQADALEASYQTAVADTTAAECTVVNAEGDILKNTAMVERASRTLGFCIIKSPVKGVILDRKVNAGQTLISNFSTPSLFLIARDLSHMSALVPVTEADIGRVKVGMPVKFTVDAYPDREFPGKVSRIRLNATLTENVVTYIVDVSVDNADRTLIPYVTANMTFVTDRVESTLKVAAGALEWHPPAEADSEPVTHPEIKDAKKESKLWVLREGAPAPVSVTPGMSDGVETAVTGDIREGDEVVVGVIEPKKS